MNNPDLFNQSHEATYCPEDNKLRLYVGRVPKEEYEALRKEGWTSTPKQECDFVATWTTRREDTALSYAGIIGDEDQSPAERAADRAERFAGYRDKRTAEAEKHADSYDAGGSAHGYQSQKKAERSAQCVDRFATRAVNAWDKATYWTSRTEGVIRNALHLSSPHVRLGRIRKIEKAQRANAKNLKEYKATYAQIKSLDAGDLSPFRQFLKVPRMQNTSELEQLQAIAEGIFSNTGYYKHPRPEDTSHPDHYRKHSTFLSSMLTMKQGAITPQEACQIWLKGKRDPDSAEFESSAHMRYARHYEHRLAYENQMIAAVGGAVAEIDLKEGDLIHGHAVLKINKSNASGKITSVRAVLMSDSTSYGCRWSKGNLLHGKAGEVALIKLTRALSNCYQPATEHSQQAIADYKAKQKETKKTAPKAPPLINPTDEDAERLQAIFNKHYSGYDGNLEIKRMTQAEYSARSKGDFGRAETRFIVEGGMKYAECYASQSPTEGREKVCKVRIYGTYQVIVLTDKPQKKLPTAVWFDVVGEAKKKVMQDLPTASKAIITKRKGDDWTDETSEMWRNLIRARLAESNYSSHVSVNQELQTTLTQMALTS